MPRKILIVDDNAINRQMLINVLQKEYDILEAENGREALALMHRYYKMLSAVLLDIVMPEMDGYDVLRAVRENALLSQIPIIMVTGTEDEDARVKVLSLGANDFILKPFNPEIVRHCLRNNIALRETASILNAIQKDKLTGLYNREAFFEKAGLMIRDREPGFYILSCFDIDNFKLINDQYGAAEGDRILREIGGAVKASMDRIGGIAARISADNFAALFPESEQNTDILQRIQDKKLVTLEQWSIVFSIGRYHISETSLAASAIYDRAYLAKQSVKGRYDKHLAYFDETMLEKLVRDQQIVGDMEAALNGRQFETWFQPQYNHVSGAIIGAEALVRWRHPQKGVIPPGEFIPLFEQNGFVYELDKYVWREACRYLRKWMDEGCEPLPVSVNISRYDIFRADLIETITGCVREFDVPIDLLRLEITESAFSKSTVLVVDLVKRLIALGFIVEIDDFGSGYSSLNTLKSVPAQVVKLDMRFLEGGSDIQRGGNILESIVRMAKWLGMSVIAEGVETQAQGDFLKSIGCSHVQGYLYARPMPAEEYEAHFRSVPKREGLSVLETAGELDNDMFWNPQSVDSLIFNSYVGSACICEYHDGRIELLRATDKFAGMLGGMSVDELLKLDPMKYLDQTASAATLAAAKKAAQAKEEMTGELLFLDLPGCPHETYIRSTMRVIASTDHRYLLYCLSENITAQRMSERKERRVARQLQLVMDNINCGITAVTMDGETPCYLLANDKFYELLGYTREQYRQEVGGDAFATISREDRARCAEIVQRTRDTGEPSSMEYRAACRDGRVVWLRSFLSMTSFEDVDEPVQICTYADITAEKNSAQTLLDNLPCGAGICVVSGGDARMTYLNKRYLTYFRHNSGFEHTGSVFSVIHPDDRAALREAMRPALDRGGEGSCVVRVMDGPDEYITFRVSGVAVESADGRNSIYVTFVPISHEELSFSEMLPVALEKMMASSSELAFVKDKDLRYICCTRAFAAMVGLESEKAVVGKTDYDLFDKSFAESYVADDRRLMEDGKSIINMVETIPSGDGRVKYSSTSKYLLYDSLGKIIGLYGTGHDITRAREAESQQQFLINSIPGGVAIYEGQWSTLESIQLAYFSDGFCRIFGYTREEYEALGAKNPIGLVAPEYLPGLAAKIEVLVRDGTPIDYIYRARNKAGGHIWIHIKAVPGERHGDNMTVNAVLFDVTEHQEALERLRVSEEENRLAIQHSQNVVCRYDVAGKSVKLSSGTSPIFELATVVEDVPAGPIREGKISPETADAYAGFFENICQGNRNGSAVYQRLSTLGWRWINAHFSTIFSSGGEPVSAVISFLDVTDSFERDIAYKKWLQSLHNKDPESFTLFRCNVSKKMVYDQTDGSLLYVRFQPGPFNFDEHTAEYVAQCVYEEDKGRFRAFLDVDAMLEKYYLGERIVTLEYRERLREGGYRWLRLTADLVEYPHSTDVEAYLLFENIDEAKRTELLTIRRAETDPLTGVYNRTTFAEKVNERIFASEPQAQHALLMLDIDGFKLVNDAFGHGAGDQTLIDVANRLRTILRRDDLVGRLGGDEFLVFLNSIPEPRIASNKAKQVCELCRKTFSEEVQITGSVGISVCPQDGASFDILYKKADEALYHVKTAGRNNFGFYREDLKSDSPGPSPDAPERGLGRLGEKKRRMLIVDDSKIDFEMLANLFREEFFIERAKDGASALVRLRHYGSAISVVLLDLMMPGMDGFAVLKKMQQLPELQTIPVVVVSGDNDRETALRAIRGGASDFVMKPVDADVLRIRVQSAVSKAENQRLRAKNSCLELQSAEAQRYEAVLTRLGLAVVEMDWGKGTFTYGPAVSDCLAGRYDSRTLWHILLSDMVADADTVRGLQQLVHSVADDRKCTEAGMDVPLKAAEGTRRLFHVHIYKLTNEYGLTDKMLLTFQNAEEKGAQEDDPAP